MIRNKIANLAKKTENRISSFKINQKISVMLAVVISIGSIGLSANKIGNASTTAYAMSETKSGLSEVVAIPTSTAQQSILDTDYNKNSLNKVTIVKHGGNEQTVLVREGNVKKALDAAHIVLGTSDVTNYKMSDNIFDGMKVSIDEVKFKNENKAEKITFEEFKKAYPNESVSSLDKNGKVLVNKTVKVKYVNGERAGEEVQSISYKSVDIVRPTTTAAKTTVKATTVKTTKAVTTTKATTTKKTQPKSTAASTKKSAKKKGVKKYSDLKTISELKPSKDFELDSKGVPVKYKKKITGTASAYCCGTHTATGKKVKPGYIAVNPKQIPYGTKLYIRSSDGNYIYGYASAEDTGGFVSWGNTVADLFFWSNSDCRQFGRRNIEIYVLD